MPVQSYKNLQEAHVLFIICISGAISIAGIIDYCNGERWNKVYTAACSVFGVFVILSIIRKHLEEQRREEQRRQLPGITDIV